jgi:mono/diheme cytochrome c family protein
VSLYALVLLAHSYVRWALVLAAVIAGLRSFVASGRGGAWGPSYERWHKTLLSLADTQFTLGALLYVWFSPISSAFFSDFRHGVHDRVLRFFGLEHAFMMVLAVAVLHIGRGRSKAAPTAKLRHRRVWVSCLAFLALAGSSIPWPGLLHGRPLFRTELSGVKAGDEKAVAGACPPTYEARCVTCHGQRGRADGIAGRSLRPAPRDFADPAWQHAASDVRIRDVIHDGGFAHGLSPSMPAQPDLGPADLDALVKCLRSFGAAPK